MHEEASLRGVGRWLLAPLLEPRVVVYVFVTEARSWSSGGGGPRSMTCASGPTPRRGRSISAGRAGTSPPILPSDPARTSAPSRPGAVSAAPRCHRRRADRLPSGRCWQIDLPPLPPTTSCARGPTSSSARGPRPAVTSEGSGPCLAVTAGSTWPSRHRCPARRHPSHDGRLGILLGEMFREALGGSGHGSQEARQLRAPRGDEPPPPQPNELTGRQAGQVRLRPTSDGRRGRDPPFRLGFIPARRGPGGGDPPSVGRASVVYEVPFGEVLRSMRRP